jgi:hypothetical protein
MFEDRYREAVILRVPSGSVADGKPVWTEYPGKAMVSDYVERDPAADGKIKSGKVFLLKCEYAPAADSQIVYNGEVFDLKSVKICRDIDSRIECCRCTCI